MDTHEQRMGAYLAEVRAKYTDAEIEALGKKGHAFKNPDGHYSFPVDDVDDLKKAVKAVGRAGADHDAVRKYIIGRAKALGRSDMIPDDWNADGSLKTSNSADPAGQQRNEPTMEDYEVSWGLKQVKKYLAGVKADQLADPDHATDPDDIAVMQAIEAAEAAIDKAIVAQSKDGRPDSGSTSTSGLWRSADRVPAVPKRAFTTLTERPAPVASIEVRMDADTDPSTAQFRGYASTTGVGYAVHDWLGEYRETIQPGAFAKTLREQSDVPLLFNHEGYPMASTGSGTSRLSEDGHGLLNEATLDRSDAATNTVCVQLKRGVLSKMSFSFRAIKDTWNDAYDERAVGELALYDTSVVTYPANPTTSAELRSMFQDMIGREGVGLMFAVRSALAGAESRQLPDTADPVLEGAIRALAHGDELMCRRNSGPLVRARTFLVAGLLEEVRKGAVLSAKNRGFLQTAVDALSAAQKMHDAMGDAHRAAADALGNVTGTNTTGVDGDQGGGNGAGGPNPLMPGDGAGPRSVPPSVLAAQREVELLKLRARR